MRVYSEYMVHRRLPFVVVVVFFCWVIDLLMNCTIVKTLERHQFQFINCVAVKTLDFPETTVRRRLNPRLGIDSYGISTSTSKNTTEFSLRNSLLNLSSNCSFHNFYYINCICRNGLMSNFGLREIHLHLPVRTSITYLTFIQLI